MNSGVLETEIDPVNPKVTVLRSAEPQVLIKKLARAGKLAELRRCTSASGPPNDQKGKEEDREKETTTEENPKKAPTLAAERRSAKGRYPARSTNQETLNSVKSCASVAANSEGFCPPPTTTEEKH